MANRHPRGSKTFLAAISSDLLPFIIQFSLESSHFRHPCADDKSSGSIVTLFGKVSFMHSKPFIQSQLNAIASENIKMALILLLQQVTYVCSVGLSWVNLVDKSEKNKRTNELRGRETLEISVTEFPMQHMKVCIAK